MRGLFVALLAALLGLIPMTALAQMPDDVPSDQWAAKALEYLSDTGFIEGWEFFKGDHPVRLSDVPHVFNAVVNQAVTGEPYPWTSGGKYCSYTVAVEALLDGATRHQSIAAEDSAYQQLSQLQRVGLLDEYTVGFFMNCGELRPWEIALAVFEARLAASDSAVSDETAMILLELTEQFAPELDMIDMLCSITPKTEK